MLCVPFCTAANLPPRRSTHPPPLMPELIHLATRYGHTYTPAVDKHTGSSSLQEAGGSESDADLPGGGRGVPAHPTTARKETPCPSQRAPYAGPAHEGEGDGNCAVDTARGKSGTVLQPGLGKGGAMGYAVPQQTPMQQQQELLLQGGRLLPDDLVGTCTWTAVGQARSATQGPALPALSLRDRVAFALGSVSHALHAVCGALLHAAGEAVGRGAAAAAPHASGIKGAGGAEGKGQPHGECGEDEGKRARTRPAAAAGLAGRPGGGATAGDGDPGRGTGTRSLQALDRGLAHRRLAVSVRTLLQAPELRSVLHDYADGDVVSRGSGGGGSEASSSSAACVEVKGHVRSASAEVPECELPPLSPLLLVRWVDADVHGPTHSPAAKVL